MPLPVLHTERLLLCPWTLDDIDALHQLWTHPDVRRYLWDDIIIPRETVEQIVDSHLDTVERCNIGYWSLHIPSTEYIAGFCGFRFIEDSPDIELMYGLHPDHWGQGLATEACRAALDYLWHSTSFKQVYARTDPPNTKSVEVMKRLGMTYHLTASTMTTYLLPRPPHS